MPGTRVVLGTGVPGFCQWVQTHTRRGEWPLLADVFANR